MIYIYSTENNGKNIFGGIYDCRPTHIHVKNVTDDEHASNDIILGPPSIQLTA